MNDVQELINTRSELFDGYNGTERNAEQQRQYDDYVAEMMKSMPGIKQADADKPIA